MFQGLFNPDNFVFRTCDRIFNLVLLSLLWLVLCLPVVTIGPATAALYYTTVKCIRRGEEGPFKNFFSSFRVNFKQGAVLSIIVGVLGALLVYWYFVLLWLVNDSGSSPFFVLYVAYLVLLVLALGVLCYLFPILSRFTMGLGGLVASAFQMAVRHLPTTLVVAAVNYLIVTLSVQFLYPIFLAPGLAALISSLLLERVFKRYMPKEPTAEGEEPPWYLK